MAIIPSVLTVKPHETLERAIAADISSMDENDFTHNFLEQMSLPYGQHYRGKRKLVVKDPSNEGQDEVLDDTEKNAKLPQNS